MTALQPGTLSGRPLRDLALGELMGVLAERVDAGLDLTDWDAVSSLPLADLGWDSLHLVEALVWLEGEDPEAAVRLEALPPTKTSPHNSSTPRSHVTETSSSRRRTVRGAGRGN